MKKTFMGHIPKVHALTSCNQTGRTNRPTTHTTHTGAMMKPVNFEKLMAKEPYMLDEMTNTQGLRIEFYEHPVFGDEVPVLVVFPAEGLAFISDFYETDDMMANGDYEPQLMDDQGAGVCMCRFEVNL